MAKILKSGFVVCLRNDGAEDLDVRKIYAVLPDEVAESRGFLRIVDESGEDYLYPAELFATVELSAQAAQALGATQTRTR